MMAQTLVPCFMFLSLSLYNPSGGEKLLQGINLQRRDLFVKNTRANLWLEVKMKFDNVQRNGGG